MAEVQVEKVSGSLPGWSLYGSWRAFIRLHGSCLTRNLTDPGALLFLEGDLDHKAKHDQLFDLEHDRPSFCSPHRECG